MWPVPYGSLFPVPVSVGNVTAVDLLVERQNRSRLARELAKLSRPEEQRLAEDGVGDESWPAF